jgi:hypothetical protein
MVIAATKIRQNGADRPLPNMTQVMSYLKAFHRIGIHFSINYHNLDLNRDIPMQLSHTNLKELYGTIIKSKESFVAVCSVFKEAPPAIRRSKAAGIKGTFEISSIINKLYNGESLFSAIEEMAEGKDKKASFNLWEPNWERTKGREKALFRAIRAIELGGSLEIKTLAFGVLKEADRTRAVREAGEIVDLISSLENPESVVDKTFTSNAAAAAAASGLLSKPLMMKLLALKHSNVTREALNKLARRKLTDLEFFTIYLRMVEACSLGRANYSDARHYSDFLSRHRKTPTWMALKMTELGAADSSVVDRWYKRFNSDAAFLEVQRIALINPDDGYLRWVVLKDPRIPDSFIEAFCKKLNAHPTFENVIAILAARRPDLIPKILPDLQRLNDPGKVPEETIEAYSASILSLLPQNTALEIFKGKIDFKLPTCACSFVGAIAKLEERGLPRGKALKTLADSRNPDYRRFGLSGVFFGHECTRGEAWEWFKAPLS